MKSIPKFKSPDSAKQVAKKYASELTTNATEAEILFQKVLKQYKIQFEFQKPIHFKDRFVIIDFYIPCQRKVLAIEIDGKAHYTKKGAGYDHERQKRLWQKNIQTVRYSNSEVFNNYAKILEDIKLQRPYYISGV